MVGTCRKQPHYTRDVSTSLAWFHHPSSNVLSWSAHWKLCAVHIPWSKSPTAVAATAGASTCSNLTHSKGALSEQHLTHVQHCGATAMHSTRSDLSC